MAKILTIDLGTTYFKISLFDRGDGHLVVSRRITPRIVASPDGRLELSVDDFEEAIGRGIAQVGGCVDGGLADVQAVTFATQTNSFILLDASDRPLTPIVLWPDGRARELETEVRRRCNVAEFSAITGIPQVNFQFMPAKLLWLQRQMPERWNTTRRICLIGDYLTLLLTGKHVTEAGVAGLTGLVDIHRCQWWSDMLARFEIDPAWLPVVARPGTDLGPPTARAAGRFGLPESCRFVMGCLDQYAGAIGVGNVEPGMVSETTGTVLATVRCAEGFCTRLGVDVFQGPAFREGLFWRMAFGELSANYLHWYREQLPDRPEFDQLTALAAEVEPGADGLRVRPGGGLTAPESVFEGMTARHTRGHAVRSILEAVAWALADQVAALSDDALPREIRCAGGAARSELWLQIKADVLGVPMVATECPEPTSLGAAMLAEAALGTADLRQIARRWARPRRPQLPQQNHRQQYQAIGSPPPLHGDRS